MPQRPSLLCPDPVGQGGVFVVQPPEWDADVARVDQLLGFVPAGGCKPEPGAGAAAVGADSPTPGDEQRERGGDVRGGQTQGAGHRVLMMIAVGILQQMPEDDEGTVG